MKEKKKNYSRVRTYAERVSCEYLETRFRIAFRSLFWHLNRFTIPDARMLIADRRTPLPGRPRTSYNMSSKIKSIFLGRWFWAEEHVTKETRNATRQTNLLVVESKEEGSEPAKRERNLCWWIGGQIL